MAGPIIFDSTNIAKTFVDFNAAYEKLQRLESIPPQLTLQRIAFNSPHGRTFAVIFVWSGSNIEEGQRWSEKIAGLGPVVANAASLKTIPEWFTGTSALVPNTGSGAAYSFNASEISTAMAESIGRSLDRMPADPGTMFSIHQLRGPSTTEGSRGLPSVFESRVPHYMVELIGFSTNNSMAEISRTWAAQAEQEARQADPGFVLSTAYVSIFNTTGFSPAEVLVKTYGSAIQTLQHLKTTFDPENLFNLALPSLE